MANPIQIGFIGAGAISELHQLSVKKIKNAVLKGFYEPNAELAEKRKKEWDVMAYPSLNALLADEHIDAVYILSPVEFHHAHALSALRAGKHVLVEKPVAMSTEQIREMIQAAEQSGKVLFPAHNYIYHPEIRNIKQLMDAGVFGRICSAWMTFNIYHSEELASHYPGVIRQIMTHHLYTTLYLLGTPRKIGCLSASLHYRDLDREDQSVIVLEMDNGAQAILFSSFACDDDTSYPFTYLVKILGTEGGACHSWRDIHFNRALGTLSKAYPKYEDLFWHESQYFIESCIQNREQPLSTIYDALTVQRLVELAEESQGERFVTL